MALSHRSTAMAGIATCALALSGCAVQAPPIVVKEVPQSVAVQREAQQAAASALITKPLLKRKIALGRMSNESTYGRSLLRDSEGDPVGKQITDMLSKALTESGAYVVLDRTDIGRIKEESKLTGVKLNLVGVDAMVMGSLTEFGRKTLGQSGFVSSSKKQVAFAKIDLRLVDVVTGQSFFAVSGAGESSTESASTFGFGSQAGYDGTLNDSSIRQAISEVVNRMTAELSSRPWQTSIIATEQGRYFISGGKAQGLKPGMLFSVQTVGKKVMSPQTGFEITLPGHELAQVRVESLFGDSEMSEGAVTSVVNGSLQGFQIEQLVVRFKEAL